MSKLSNMRSIVIKCVTAKRPYSFYVDMKDTNCLAFVGGTSTCCELMRHKDLTMVLNILPSLYCPSLYLWKTLQHRQDDLSGWGSWWICLTRKWGLDEFVSPGSTPHLGMITDADLKDPWLWSGLEKVTLLSETMESRIFWLENTELVNGLTTQIKMWAGGGGGHSYTQQAFKYKLICR